MHSVRAMCSSYLPEWRPGVDWKKCYSAHADMGGGVDIDLIHEWDYLTYLFGFPHNVYSIRGQFSDVTADSCDNAIYIGEYPHIYDYNNYDKNLYRRRCTSGGFHKGENKFP